MDFAREVPSLLKDETDREEEEEDESNHVTDEVNLDQQLEHFRDKWQQELRRERKRSESGETLEPRTDMKDQAQQYFLMGCKLEQEGSFYQAIEFYKMAMQLVPDIEYQMDEVWDRVPRERMESESSVDENLDPVEDEMDLLVRFQNLSTEDNALCQAALPQRACHISELPVEVLIYIFKWVVSTQLDMKSLEILSEVCRGFFLCARDEEMWRIACISIWGANTGKTKKYGTWRNMFVERPHLHFTGCYIAATSYIRQGEKSLDNFYRPYHCVEYYRYVRFFAEGVMLMMTSPEEPVLTLPKLKSRNGRVPGILCGYYRLSGDKVTGVMKRYQQPETKAYNRNKRNKNQVIDNTENKMTYHVEFTISSIGKKNGTKLIWDRYSVKKVYKHTGEEILDDFELKNNTFPPLFYSRVKNFMRDADVPLK